MAHAQVWKQPDWGLGPSETFRRRAEVQGFLDGLREKLVAARIRHRVDELVFDSEMGAGAALGHAESRDVEERAETFVWFEVKDDRIARYIVRPRSPKPRPRRLRDR